MRTRILVPLALLMLFLIGCDVRIDKTALSLKYDPRTDTLEGVCINEGIFTVKDKAILCTTETIIDCLEGKRSLYFGYGRHCIDFEDTDPEGEPDLLWANYQMYIDSADIYLDGQERLSAVQRFHVTQFSGFSTSSTSNSTETSSRISLTSSPKKMTAMENPISAPST